MPNVLMSLHMVHFGSLEKFFLLQRGPFETLGAVLPASPLCNRQTTYW